MSISRPPDKRGFGCRLLKQLREKLEFVELFAEWYSGGKWDAARAPLCKGSCREATEGLCGTIFRLWKCIGKKVRGNDFAVESSGFDGTSAKWGQNGHGAFGRWAHREVCHYNPSVSFADSSPYTGEPLPHTASNRTPLNKQLCKFQFIRLPRSVDMHFSFFRLYKEVHLWIPFMLPGIGTRTRIPS